MLLLLKLQQLLLAPQLLLPSLLLPLLPLQLYQPKLPLIGRGRGWHRVRLVVLPRVDLQVRLCPKVHVDARAGRCRCGNEGENEHENDNGSTNS